MKTFTNIIIAASLLTTFACRKDGESSNQIVPTSIEDSTQNSIDNSTQNSIDNSTQNTIGDNNQNPIETPSQALISASCLVQTASLVVCAELKGTSEEVADDECMYYSQSLNCEELIQESHPSSLSFGSCSFSHPINNQDAKMYFNYADEITYDSALSFVDTIEESCSNGEYGNNGRYSYPDNLQDLTQEDDSLEQQENQDDQNETPATPPVPVLEEEEVTVSCLESGITFDSNYNTVNFLKCSQFVVSPDQVDVERTWCNYDPQAAFAEVGCEDRYTHRSTYFLGKCEGSYSTKFFYKTDGNNLQGSKQAVRDNRCYLGDWTDGWI